MYLFACPSSHMLSIWYLYWSGWISGCCSSRFEWYLSTSWGYMHSSPSSSAEESTKNEHGLGTYCAFIFWMLLVSVALLGRSVGWLDVLLECDVGMHCCCLASQWLCISAGRLGLEVSPQLCQTFLEFGPHENHWQRQVQFRTPSACCGEKVKVYL